MIAFVVLFDENRVEVILVVLATAIFRLYLLHYIIWLHSIIVFVSVFTSVQDCD